MVPASSNPCHSYETVNRVDDWFPSTQMHQGQEIAVASTKPLTSLGRNGFQTIVPNIIKYPQGLAWLEELLEHILYITICHNVQLCFENPTDIAKRDRLGS